MMYTIPIYSNDPWLINFIKSINPSFTTIQLKNASRICQGLLSSMDHKSIASIAEALVEARDQSSLNRFLNESNWGLNPWEMDANRIKVMQRYKQTSFTSGGSIVIDDSLLAKSGKAMDLVHPHFDHCSFVMQPGLSLVTTNYSDDAKNYNLLKEAYLRKEYLEHLGASDQFKTKIKIATEFIEKIVETVPSVLAQKPTFLFDSWFLSKPVVGTLKKYELKYVSRAKSNRIIVGLHMNLKEYADTVLKPTAFKEITIQSVRAPESLFAYTAILPISNLGDVKVVFVKNELNGPVKAYLVSNDLKRSGTEIIEAYKARWPIETDYKNNKQYLGLSEFHLRKKEGILRYLTLCFLTSTYLEYCRLMGIFGHSFGKRVDLSSKGKEVRAYQHLMFERFLIWLDYQFSQEKNLYDLMRFFRDEATHCIDAIQFVHQSTLSSLIIEGGGM